MKFGSLFSGIAGIDLGLERAGMQCIWQSEIDPYASRVLAKHWPDVPNLGDIRTIDWDSVERPDLICGGYPCQPFSTAGARRGTDDERHLWPYFADGLRHLRPRFALLENVPGHLSLGFDAVLSDLAQLGFDAEWSVLSACRLGAPHTRERLFVLAYATGGDESDYLSHCFRQAFGNESRGSGSGTWRDWWLSEPNVDRVAVGLPSRVVRDPLRALGNAVVPQVAEYIGRMILECVRND